MRKAITMFMVALMTGAMAISCDTNDKLETLDQELEQMKQDYKKMQEEQAKLQEEYNKLQKDQDKLREDFENKDFNADEVGEIFDNALVDTPVQYPGGEAALLKWIGQNLKYPEEAKAQGLQGTVIAKMVIDQSGKVVKCEIMKSLSSECDAEVRRLCMALQPFKPASHQGKIVSVYYTLPVRFRL